MFALVIEYVENSSLVVGYVDDSIWVIDSSHNLVLLRSLDVEFTALVVEYVVTSALAVTCVDDSVLIVGYVNVSALYVDSSGDVVLLW